MLAGTPVNAAGTKLNDLIVRKRRATRTGAEGYVVPGGNTPVVAIVNPSANPQRDDSSANPKPDDSTANSKPVSTDNLPVASRDPVEVKKWKEKHTCWCKDGQVVGKDHVLTWFDDFPHLTNENMIPLFYPVELTPRSVVHMCKYLAHVVCQTEHMHVVRHQDLQSMLWRSKKRIDDFQFELNMQSINKCARSAIAWPKLISKGKVIFVPLYVNDRFMSVVLWATGSAELYMRVYNSMKSLHFNNA